ncbi:hypothetical protein CGL27_49155 (plasmid) [Streptomyces sp. 11-1-2]|nr:hypothetical protein CGL27_49155 [Streptomyces sp. 11-1-2]
MEACRIGWDATGTTYAGACLSAVAAQQLNQASGIPARTVAAWLQQIRTGSGLTGVDVLVVDEATMVDDRAAEVLMREAARTGTQIIGIGDPLQSRRSGPAAGSRRLTGWSAGSPCTENRRQEDAAERHALEVWRTGDHDRRSGCSPTAAVSTPPSRRTRPARRSSRRGTSSGATAGPTPTTSWTSWWSSPPATPTSTR